MCDIIAEIGAVSRYKNPRPALSAFSFQTSLFHLQQDFYFWPHQDHEGQNLIKLPLNLLKYE